ncbi:MAG: DUF1592 domain-containing protein [Myxococcaceae bacterium]
MPVSRPLLILALLSSACVGQIAVPKPATPHPAPVQMPPSPPPVVSACTGTPSVAPTVARRMTRWEYDNTLRDLLGDQTQPAAAFDAEEEVLGFNNNSGALTTSSAMVQKLISASEGVASRATQNLAAIAWVSCNGTYDDTCAAAFIDAFTSRAWRRALTADEHQALTDLYDSGKMIGGLDADGGELSAFDSGVQLVIEAVLQSPDFLYRLEDATTGSTQPVTGYEMASRLSYLLWGSTPDDALLTAAGSGQLDTPAQVLTQAQRMIEDPRARQLVVQFHQQWLDFDRISKVGKAASIYPDWSNDIGVAMFQETSQFVEHVVFDGEGTWDALLGAQYSYLNPQLASFYGASGGMNNAGFAKTALDAQHAGLLTQGTMMTINAHSDQTSPVHRGKLIREQYLCQPLPPPPAGVVIQVPAPDSNTTARQRFAEHSNNPQCSGCHTLMDGVGFGFENFDGIGRFRTTENNQTIDASGSLIGADVAGDFQGAAGLAQKLLQSTAAKNCYVKQWFRYGYGRGEQPADACSLERLEKSFEADGHGVKSLLLSLSGSDAFLYKAGAP